MNRIRKQLSVLLLALVIFITSFSGCSASRGDKYIEKEERACINYFLDCAQNDTESDGYGLVWDKSNNSSMASIAATGFALAAIPFAVQKGWLKHGEGFSRVLGTLKTFQKISNVSGQCYNGFFFHFIDTANARRFGSSEVSVIDSALFIAGALVAGEYFGGEVKDIAVQLYENIDWNFYLDKNKDMFYMSYMPGGGFSGNWDVYGEQLIIYFLATGAPNPQFRISSSTYYKFTRMRGSYNDGDEYIYSWFNSLFTYQFSHIFIDFRNMTDKNNVNWFDNSVIASKTHYNYTVQNAASCKTYSDKSWGFTASEGKYGYNAEFYIPPAQNKPTSVIAPSAAIASMPFTYNESYPALKHYQTITPLNDDRLGLLDAYDLDNEWYCKFAVGLNKGNTVLMLANYESGFVWEYFMQNIYIQNAIKILEFN